MSQCARVTARGTADVAGPSSPASGWFADGGKGHGQRVERRPGCPTGADLHLLTTHVGEAVPAAPCEQVAVNVIEDACMNRTSRRTADRAPGPSTAQVRDSAPAAQAGFTASQRPPGGAAASTPLRSGLSQSALGADGPPRSALCQACGAPFFLCCRAHCRGAIAATQRVPPHPTDRFGIPGQLRSVDQAHRAPCLPRTRAFV